MNRLNWCLLILNCIAAVLFIVFVGILTPEKTTSARASLGTGSDILDSFRAAPKVADNTDVQSEVVPSIQFFGDVLLARNVERLMQKNGLSYPFVHLTELLASGTTAFANFEAAVPLVHIPTPDLVTTFSVRNSYLEQLRSSGISYVTLANNHSFDYGQSGYQNTLRSLFAADITAFGNPNTVGTTSVVYRTLGTTRIAIIAMDAVFTNPDHNELTQVITQTILQSDIQIAYIHWGTEYQTTHSFKQEKFARTLVDLGIDAIIGHHPHVVQDVQLIDSVPVFYSLGNFIFDQYFSRDVQTGLSVVMYYENGQLLFSLVPISSLSHRSQPEKLVGTAAEEFLQSLALQSDQRLAQNIKQGKVISSVRLATSTKTSIILE